MVGSAGSPPLKDKFSPTSQFMALVEYDSAALTMDIHFHSGTHKRYLYCFPTTYQSFKESPTHDAYFSKAIRGRLSSITIKDASIGKQQKSPLKAIKQRRHIEHGVNKWQAGTVARAGL